MILHSCMMLNCPSHSGPDRTLFMLHQMLGDVHPNPGPATKYLCPICARNVTSRGVSYQCNRCSGWVHAKCARLLNAAQYRRSSDWACDPCSTPQPSPPTDQKSYDSTFNVLQLNANGIGNKLTERGVVMENNKVKVARPHGQSGGLLIFTHRWVTFSKQPSSAESLYDPHLEELAIETEIG